MRELSPSGSPAKKPAGSPAKQDAASPLITGGARKPAVDLPGQLQAQEGGEKPKQQDELSEEEKEAVAKLRERDAEVHRHEQAHAAAGGQYAGVPSYTHQQGPDGKRYAVGGNDTDRHQPDSGRSRGDRTEAGPGAPRRLGAGQPVRRGPGNCRRRNHRRPNYPVPILVRRLTAQSRAKSRARARMARVLLH